MTTNHSALRAEAASALGCQPDELVFLLRTCTAEMGSTHEHPAAQRFRWPGHGLVSAADWDPADRCGGGLHGLPRGEGSVGLLSQDPTAKWLVWAAVAAEVVAITADGGGKSKAPRGYVVHVGDRASSVELTLALHPGSGCVYGTATAGYAGTATAGDAGTATAGDAGTATAGARGTATAGADGTATAGARGTATAGYAGTATAGYAGTATAGYAGTATAGYAGTATAGYAGTATAGYAGTATAGDAGTATAGDAGTATAGARGTATAGADGTATAGARGTATAGADGTATAGYAGTATAGYAGTATAGYAGTATAGYAGTATAGYAGTATAGDAGTATAGDAGSVSICWWDHAANRRRRKLGECGIDVLSYHAYRLSERGEWEDLGDVREMCAAVEGFARACGGVR